MICLLSRSIPHRLSRHSSLSLSIYDPLLGFRLHQILLNLRAGAPELLTKRKNRPRTSVHNGRAVQVCSVYDCSYGACYCIPPEICTQFLSYLPVKSILQFRSVSKEWKSIIDNPNFASLHLSHYSNNYLDSHLIILESPPYREHVEVHMAHLFSRSPVAEYYRETSEFSFLVPHLVLDRDRLTEQSIIAGAVDGLLLVLRKRERMIQGDLVLWNPSIRKSINIPLPPGYLSLSSILDVSLGFDTFTNDYKVVNIVHHEQLITLEIFSLSSPSWRKGRTLEVGGKVRHLIRKQSNKVSFQGSVHWVGEDRNEDGVFDKAFISLNLISEAISYTQLPDAEYYSVNTPIVVAGSLMGLMTFNNEVSVIWVLEMDGHWSKRFTLEIGTSNLNWDIFNPQLYLNKDGVLIWKANCQDYATPRNVVKIDTEICASDINTRKKSVVLRCAKWFPFYIGAYTESLVLLS